MKFSKCALVLAVFVTAGSLLAKETVSYNEKAQWQGNASLSQIEGGIALKGNTFVLSKPFPVDLEKKYTIRYTVSVKDLPADEKLTLTIGFFVYNAGKRVIFCDNICAVKNSFTKTLADAKKGDTAILVEKAAKANAQAWNNLAIGAKEDLSDLPNWNIVGRNVKSIAQQDNGWLITFASPLTKDVPAETFVRLQSTGGYLGTGGYGVKVTTEPQTITGSIQGTAPAGIWTKSKWPVGTASAALFIQPATKAKDFTLEFKDFSIEVE